MATTIESYTVNDDGAPLSDATTTKFAQSFTIGTTGTNGDFPLSSVTVKIFRAASPSTITASIFNTDPAGLPTGAAISTGTIEGNDLSTTNSTSTPWVNIVMSATTLKTSGVYWLELEPASSTGTNKLGWRRDETAPAYTGGDSYEWTTVWTAQSADNMFAVFGGDYAGTLCTLGEAINKGGANASSVSTEEALVSNFVRQAEGVINAVTKFDWVTAYSGLTDQVKFLLNQVASDLAAIYIITYDMSAYTAETVEAETMLNIYRESVARGLSLLRDKNVKTFMTGDT